MPRRQYQLVFRETNRKVPFGFKFRLYDIDWTLIGIDTRRRIILVQRPAKPGESNLSPSGLQMPFVVRILSDGARYDLGWQWK